MKLKPNTFFLITTLSSTAYADGEENKVAFDFSKMSISTFGVSTTNQEEQNGSLKAEVNARKMLYKILKITSKIPVAKWKRAIRHQT